MVIKKNCCRYLNEGMIYSHTIKERDTRDTTTLYIGLSPSSSVFSISFAGIILVAFVVLISSVLFVSFEFVVSLFITFLLFTLFVLVSFKLVVFKFLSLLGGAKKVLYNINGRYFQFIYSGFNCIIITGCPALII